ncbi:hypothetical protein QAD02_018169 [Eretmocerus hayati]|uniref:Uncharacterized protein n=1 Tax=Eretmocerus hayati TaxID=131215 RepID=A0ACC2PJ00_9HYME|nr:hypothetical protein QAD02_018169 [Eretmocerus hayati]
MVSQDAFLHRDGPFQNVYVEDEGEVLGVEKVMLQRDHDLDFKVIQPEVDPLEDPVMPEDERDLVFRHFEDVLDRGLGNMRQEIMSTLYGSLVEVQRQQDVGMLQLRADLEQQQEARLQQFQTALELQQQPRLQRL